MNLNPHQIITALKEQISKVEKAIQELSGKDKEQKKEKLLRDKFKLEKQIELIKQDISADKHIQDKDTTTHIDDQEEVSHFDLFLTIPRLIKEGGFNNYLVFNIDLEKNYFIDITSKKNGTELCCNAVSNYHLEERYQLDADKINILLEKGWIFTNDEMQSNFYNQVFSLDTKEELKNIIDSILFVIENVYGTKFSKKLEMRFYLG